MNRLFNMLLLLLAVLLALQAGLSLQWPIAHDEAPLFYEAFLMHTEGRVPYRDLFDFQMPGSFAAYYLLGRLGGFEAFRLRVIDLFLLAALSAVTHGLMRPFGRIPAFAAWILFDLHYLGGGPSISLQREFLLLIFVAAGARVFVRSEPTAGSRLVIGVLFGLAALIKPHASIGLLPILALDLGSLARRREASADRALVQSPLSLMSGFGIPILAALGWLALSGGLIPFLEIAAGYWPLYAQVNGQMEVTAGAARLSFILGQVWRLGGNWPWVFPAAIGISLVSDQLRRPARLLAGLAFCYALYPALSGQFFPYHYLPFAYFILLSACLCASETIQRWRVAALGALMVAIAATVRPSAAAVRQVEGRPIVTSTDRAAEMARFLEKNLEAGDTVQPLDWTGGALLALLERRASLATPYVFDFYFYHHVSEPYIQSLRRDFLRELQQARPRFIIEVTAIDKPWITGEDATREFPELRAYLDGNYSARVRKDDYVIHERR
jgi:hypothetical protein